jgi:hypothetical protein
MSKEPTRKKRAYETKYWVDLNLFSKLVWWFDRIFKRGGWSD